MNNYKLITERTEEFAIRIIKACSWLINQGEVQKTLGRQLLGSGTSIGANVHESRSAQSDKDFINKLEIALKEARETEYWLKILIKSELVKKDNFQPLLDEGQEIVRILIASVAKKKQNL